LILIQSRERKIDIYNIGIILAAKRTFAQPYGPNNLVSMTSLLPFVHSFFLAQIEYSTSAEGKAPGPIFWIIWAAFIIFMIAFGNCLAKRANPDGPRLFRS
jgi:hypothetical protein